MTHKKRDCLDRPRKKGAKHTGLDIKPDESIVNIHLGFEAKRDRWNGYQPESQLDLVKEYQLVDEKRQLNRQKQNQDELDDFQADNVDQTVDTKSRLTVRNLRMREDTAKYLRNLDPESAYYDPKTRSMRDNPYGNGNGELYAGDGFERYSGEVKRAVEISSFSWEDGKLNSVQSSNPTLAEKMVREKKGEVKRVVDKGLLAKYGGEEYLSSIPTELLVVDEEYVTYTATGDKIGEKVKVKLVSKYKEDVFPGNHSSVWGSWYEDGKWGFKCCREVLKSAYCGGRQSIDAKLAQKRKRVVMEAVQEEDEAQEPAEKSLMELHRENAVKNQMAGEHKMTTEEVETEEYQKTRIRKNDPMEKYFKSK
jgi:pre-mRNA-processing factor SLU7